MPQMGESVAEGTIVRWLKKVGDAVERDEPLFEISTDKVDAEIPSPIAGVLSDVKVKEGETVPINTVVGLIDETASKPAAAAKPAEAPAKPAEAPAKPAKAPAKEDVPVSSAQGDGDTSGRFGPYAPYVPGASASAPPPSVAPRAPAFAARSAASARQAPAPAAPGLAKPWSAAEARELRLSPVVRKIAREHHIDVRNIAGSGDGGRVTKSDIQAYLDAGAPASAPPASASAQGATASKEAPAHEHPESAPLRIVYCGTPQFAVPTLEKLLASRHIVCGVITQPDRPRGRGQKLQPGPVKLSALQHHVPVFQPERLRTPDVRGTLRSWAPDLGVVAAYGKLIPEDLLAVPRLGMINVHA